VTASALLLQAGKIHFGYIYGFGAFGNVAIYTIMNLMATTGVSGGHEPQHVQFDAITRSCALFTRHDHHSLSSPADPPRPLQHSLDMSRTFSVLGYALLPIVGIAVLAVFFTLRNVFGAVLGVLCIAWCTACATKFFEAALAMHNQRWLIAYPVFLFYACFALITIF